MAPEPRHHRPRRQGLWLPLPPEGRHREQLISILAVACHQSVFPKDICNIIPLPCTHLSNRVSSKRRPHRAFPVPRSRVCTHVTITCQINPLSYFSQPQILLLNRVLSKTNEQGVIRENGLVMVPEDKNGAPSNRIRLLVHKCRHSDNRDEFRRGTWS